MSESHLKKEEPRSKSILSCGKRPKIEAIKRDMELGELVEQALRQELKRPTLSTPKMKQPTIKGDKA